MKKMTEMICNKAKECSQVRCLHKEPHKFVDSIADGKCNVICMQTDGFLGAVCITKMTYEEWKLKLIKLIVDQDFGEYGSLLKIQEINCVLVDDCDYPQAFKDGETPEEVWQGEIDAIGDSQ